MLTSATIITGGDSQYFPWLIDLLDSFQARDVFNRFSVGILDVGLADDQLIELSTWPVQVTKPDWPFPGMMLSNEPEWYKAIVCRPFLPQYFPGTDYVFWIDADSWVQNHSVLELFLAGAMRDGFSVAPITEGAYPPSIINGRFRDWNYQCYATGFGKETAERYYRYPILAAGVLCGARDAPHWKIWQQLTEQALNRQIYKEAEQTALNLLVHSGLASVHLMPAYSHWICNICPPAYDPDSHLIVEPNLPHTPIGIIGLAANSKKDSILIPQPDGLSMVRLLTYRNHQRTLPINIRNGNPYLEVDGSYGPTYLRTILLKLAAISDVFVAQLGACASSHPINVAIRQFRWSGIIVEPLSDLIDELRHSHGNRSDLAFANFAISEHTPLHDFIVQHRIDHIDFLLINTEIHEYEIMRQVDFTRLLPRVVCIKINHLLLEELQKCIDVLRRGGFSLYVCKDKPELLAVDHSRL